MWKIVVCYRIGDFVLVVCEWDIVVLFDNCVLCVNSDVCVGWNVVWSVVVKVEYVWGDCECLVI